VAFSIVQLLLLWVGFFADAQNDRGVFAVDGILPCPPRLTGRQAVRRGLYLPTFGKLSE